MAEELITTTATPAPGSDDVTKRIEAALYGSTEPEAPAKQDTRTQRTPDKEETDPETAEDEKEPEGQTAEDEEEAEPDEEKEESEEKPESEDETEGELTTAQVSKLLGVKESHLQVDDDGKLLFRTKVGEDINHVTLDQLVKSYQTDKHISKKAQKLYDEQQEFETVKTQEKGELFKQVSEAAALVRTMEQQLLGNVNTADLERLRQSNPAEWAARRQELQDRYQFIQQVKGQLGTTLQAQTQKQQQAAEEARVQRAAKEAEKILAKIPRWSDESVAAVEIPKMQTFLTEHYGFEASEIGTIPDHRFVLLALDAMKGKSMLESTEKVSQKLQKIPKIIKAGATGTKDKVTSASKTDEKRLRLKKSGKTADLAALLYDRI